MNQALGDVLKQTLRQKGLTYQDVATHLNMSEVSIKRIFNFKQNFSVERLMQLAELLEIPISVLFREAEERSQTWPLFSAEQDAAFCAEPSVFYFFSELTDGHTVEEIQARFQLTDASAYLYLRKLEKLSLVTITHGLTFNFSVPKHISFSLTARFPTYFKRKTLTKLTDAVCDQPLHEERASITLSRIEMTTERFKQLCKQTEELIYKAVLDQAHHNELTKSQTYTVATMAVLGDHFDAEKYAIPNIDGSSN